MHWYLSCCMVGARIVRAALSDFRTWSHALIIHPHTLALCALAVSVATLAVVLLLELRSSERLRAKLGTDLARIAEQLEQLRADSREPCPAPSPLATPSPWPAPSPSDWSTQLARAERGPGVREEGGEAEGPAGAEVRLLASMASARARRALRREPRTDGQAAAAGG